MTAAYVALVLSVFSLGWQIVSFALERRRQDTLRDDESTQALQGFVDYLADVRSLNKPPVPSGAKLWGAAAIRLSRTRERLVETIASLPPGHGAREELVDLTKAFHDWTDAWDYYRELADTDTGEAALMDALKELQTARWTAEDNLRSEFELQTARSRPAFDDLLRPLDGKRHEG